MRTVFLSGNLGKDAELKTGKSGKSYLSFSVGSTERKYDGTKETVWINCTMPGGEKLHPYLTKGTKVAIVGKPNEKNGDDGKPVHYLTVNEIELLGNEQKKEQPQAMKEAAKKLQKVGFKPADDDDEPPF